MPPPPAVFCPRCVTQPDFEHYRQDIKFYTTVNTLCSTQSIKELAKLSSAEKQYFVSHCSRFVPCTNYLCIGNDLYIVPVMSLYNDNAKVQSAGQMRNTGFWISTCGSQVFFCLSALLHFQEHEFLVLQEVNTHIFFLYPNLESTNSFSRNVPEGLEKKHYFYKEFAIMILCQPCFENVQHQKLQRKVEELVNQQLGVGPHSDSIGSSSQ